MESTIILHYITLFHYIVLFFLFLNSERVRHIQESLEQFVEALRRDKST